MSGSGKEGVVVVSFGSMLDIKTLPEMVELMVSSFSSIPQRILWASPSTPANIPPNVKMVKWMPQNDVLGE